MNEKEQQLRTELAELDKKLEDPAIYSDKSYPKLAKRKSELDDVIALFDTQAKLEKQLAEAQAMAHDSDIEVA